MDKVNVERLKLLLKAHEEILEEKRVHPEAVPAAEPGVPGGVQGGGALDHRPVLEEIKDLLVGKVESASIFHGMTAAGLKIKLDRWEDYERSLLFFGDAGAQVGAHHPRGGRLRAAVAGGSTLSEITPALVEEEAMKFLRRLFGDEQLRRPGPAGGRGGRGHAAGAPGRRPMSPGGYGGGRYGTDELVRV